jgi:dipeptidyl-peptidase-4
MSRTESFPRQAARTRRFTLGQPRSFAVARDGTRVVFLRSVSGTDARTGLWCLDLPEGKERCVVDPAAFEADVDLPAAEKARRERVRETASGVVAYSVDASGRTAVFSVAGRLHVADLDDGTWREIPTVGAVFDPQLDPRGRHVGYVSGRDLRVVDVDGRDDRVLASDPADTVSWGRAEHVAAEEMNRSRGFWWSPHGDALLATRVDDVDVQTWWIADPAHPDRPPVAVRYPRAGTSNADVSLHLLGIDGSRREISWDRGRFCYLARVSWSSAGPPLLLVQTRDQRTTQVLAVDTASGTTELVHEDSDDIWVEVFDGVPVWCGNRVVHIADTGGARRLFVGGDAVTPAALYVRAVASADDDTVVFTASSGDPTQVHVMRWSAAGIEQFTRAVGVHSVISHSGTTVITSSGLDWVGQRHQVCRGDHVVALESRAEQPVLMPAVRILALGVSGLRAGLLLPTGHRPGDKVPVLVDPYGGPHVQRVLAAGRAWLEPQWLADKGFAVLVTDGRGTPGRDPDWERRIHHNLAAVLDDQVEALLAAAEFEPDLDLTRVGIRGWSFGGYLAALAVLRRPDVFHAAVAGAPVTDWTLYDTHYTERYLGLPQDEPAVYLRNSLLDDAATLSRPLLMIHGLADDNVVAAHTLLLSQRLTEAGRPHHVVPLTGVTHMTPQEEVAENLLLLQVEFLSRVLADRTG